MSEPYPHRGGAPVGFIHELEGTEAAAVIYLRLWSDGPQGRSNVCADFTAGLGAAQGKKAFQAFESLCRLCTQHHRRPLMRHAVQCKCLGGDEACFANFVGAAATGAREDALLIATLLVRPDVAPLITALAADFGLALKRMNLCAPRDVRGSHAPNRPSHTTVH